MKRKKRDFSPRERRLIDGFIKDICRSIGLPQGIRDLHQCAWEAFLSVYRDAPFAFCGDGISGWKRAYLIIDFLHRIKSRDTRLMAYDLMAGDTIDEIRTYRRWSRDHTYRTYNRLRLRMEEYLSI